MSNVIGDPKAPEKEAVKTVYNRTRANKYFVLKDGRRLLPGQSLEVGLAEYKKLVGYKEIIDADKLVPAAAEKSIALQAENVKLNAQLKKFQDDPVIAERLKEIAAAIPEPKEEEKKPKSKGKP